MKRLWKSQKTSGALLNMIVAIGAAIVASVLFLTLPIKPEKQTIFALEIGIAYGFSAALFALHLLPVLTREHKVNKLLINGGHSLAQDQKVSVVFKPNGILDEIFYQDTSYKNDPKYKEFYRIFSEPAYYNPQRHSVHIPQFPNEDFLVITERMPNGQVFATVYDAPNDV